LKLWQQKNETSMKVVERATHMFEDWRLAQLIRGAHGLTVSSSQPNLNNYDKV